MFNKKASWIGGFFMLLLSACNNKNAVEYAHYLTAPENGLTQKQVRGAVGFSATYQPVDFVVAKNLVATERHAAGLRAARAQYLGLQYINFEIFTEGGAAGQNGLKKALEKQSDAADWATKMDYFNFQMQPDLSLIVGKDTLPCAFYHLEQTGNLGNRLRFFLGFKERENRAKPHFSDDLHLLYNDRMISKDTLHFVFARDKLNQIPDLAL